MNKYIVTSKTTREKQGRPELCWMDIGVRKLQIAAEEQATYDFLCLIDERLYEYTVPADALLRVFNEKNVKINERGKKYTFFFEYATGTLFRSIARKSKDEVCRLAAGTVEGTPDSPRRAVEQKKKLVREELKAQDVLEDVLEIMGCSYLPQLIARTSLWATREEYEACLAKGSTAKEPKIRRKKPGEARGYQNGVHLYLDSNNDPNSQMKSSLKKRGLIPKGYETCHIWEGSCYDPRYHTCYANLVLLPRAVASLSDHSESIRAILKYRAFKLFGFKPEGEDDPECPKNYPAESEWCKL